MRWKWKTNSKWRQVPSVPSHAFCSTLQFYSSWHHRPRMGVSRPQLLPLDHLVLRKSTISCVSQILHFDPQSCSVEFYGEDQGRSHPGDNSLVLASPPFPRWPLSAGGLPPSFHSAPVLEILEMVHFSGNLRSAGPGHQTWSDSKKEWSNLPLSVSVQNSRTWP